MRKAPSAESQPIRLEWRDPAELDENPANWRRHPQEQSDGLEAVIREVGWAGALLYNETTGRLIDGHARKKLPEDLAVDGKVPVLVGEWTEDQERTILATLDPLGAMAEADSLALADLLESISTDDETIGSLLAGIGETEAHIEPDPPEDFPEIDESLPTEHTCPECGYQWSGSA